MRLALEKRGDFIFWCYEEAVSRKSIIHLAFFRRESFLCGTDGEVSNFLPNTEVLPKFFTLSCSTKILIFRRSKPRSHYIVNYYFSWDFTKRKGGTTAFLCCSLRIYSFPYFPGRINRAVGDNSSAHFLELQDVWSICQIYFALGLLFIIYVNTTKMGFKKVSALWAMPQVC